MFGDMRINMDSTWIPAFAGMTSGSLLLHHGKTFSALPGSDAAPSPESKSASPEWRTRQRKSDYGRRGLTFVSDPWSPGHSYCTSGVPHQTAISSTTIVNPRTSG
jgi:hypothetical protein